MKISSLSLPVDLLSPDWWRAWYVAIREDKLAAAVIPVLFAGLLAAVSAYFFAEKWQRWRQLRDFRYRALLSFSAATHRAHFALGIATRRDGPSPDLEEQLRLPLAEVIAAGDEIEVAFAGADSDAALLGARVMYLKQLQQLATSLVTHGPPPDIASIIGSLTGWRRLILDLLAMKADLLTRKDFAKRRAVYDKEITLPRGESPSL